MVRRLAMLGLLAMALTGCGGNDDGGNDSGSSTDASSEQQGQSERQGTTAKDKDCATLLPSSREGECELEGGVTLKVVNRDSPLRLDDLSARITDVETKQVLRDEVLDETSEANGTYALIRLKMKNLSDSPADFSTAGDQVALQIGQKEYSSVDFDVQGPVNPLLIQQKIQPDSSEDGYTIFEIPRKAAKDLETADSGLIVFSFANSEAGVESATSAGYIRLSK